MICRSTFADSENSVCVASCIVLVILIQWPATTTQLPYDYAMFCVWGAVEVNIAIVSGKKHSTESDPYNEIR